MPESDSSDAARKRAPKGGIRIGGKFFQGGTLLPRPENVVKYRREQRAGRVSIDPASRTPGAPPNFGRPTAPHIFTFMGVTGSMAKTYRNPDEAIKHAIDNARIMRNDCSVMECLEARQRVTALLNWHLEPEDKKSQKQKELCDRLTSIIKLIPQFTEYRRNLLEALWFGRYAVENIYGVDYSTGKRRFTVNRWVPRHGDKLVFRYDDGSGKYDPDEVGIRVGTTLTKEDHIAGRRLLDYADIGLCYFLEPWERTRLTLHKHIIEDAAFEDPTNAGSIHGVGIRSRIYWTWFQKQETLAQLMELVERTGNGFTIYFYPSGNEEARQEVEEVAKQQAHTNVVLMPHDFGNPDGFRVEQIPPNTAGIEALRSMVHEHFGHQIKRYILGQTLSTESDATGLGSGVADLHDRSLNQIARYDATKLEETITTELVTPLKNFNEPAARNIRVLFKIDTESPDAEKKLEAYRQAYDMGCKIRAQDVMDLIGAGMPSGDEEILQNPQFQQQIGLPGGGMPSPEDGGNPTGGQPADDQMSIEDLFGPLAEAETDGEADEPQKLTYAADPSEGMSPGETKTINGKTYRLNRNHRWELADGQENGGQVLSGKDATSLGDKDLKDVARKNLKSVHKPIGGLMSALHESEEFQQYGTAYSRDVHPQLAEDIYGWLAENAGQEAGGGRVVNLGNGRLGFSSAAGAVVVAPTKSGSWQVSYTVQTQLVAQTSSGGAPVAQPPENVDTETESDTVVEPEEVAQQEQKTGESDDPPNAGKPIKPVPEPKQPTPTDTNPEPPLPTETPKLPQAQVESQAAVPPSKSEQRPKSRQRYDQALEAFENASKAFAEALSGLRLAQAEIDGLDDPEEDHEQHPEQQPATRSKPTSSKPQLGPKVSPPENEPTVENEFTQGTASQRKMAVKRALAEGREVPTKVLSQYPELRQSGREDAGAAAQAPSHSKPQAQSPAAGEKEVGATAKKDIVPPKSDVASKADFKPGQIVEFVDRDGRKQRGEFSRILPNGTAFINQPGGGGPANLKTVRPFTPDKFEAGETVEIPEFASSADGSGKVVGINSDGTYSVVVGSGRQLDIPAHRLINPASSAGAADTDTDDNDDEDDLPLGDGHSPVVNPPKPASPSAQPTTAVEPKEDSGEAKSVELPEQFHGASDRELANFLKILGYPAPKARGKRHAQQLREQVREALLETGLAKFKKQKDRDSLLQAIESAAAETDLDPSPEQKAAGNFAKGKLRLHGLQVAIETPRGAIRSGTDPNGNPWSIEMPHHYGYICRTESEADGDQVDIFIGPDPDSEIVFVVDQVGRDGESFDEHKVMLGWKSVEAARDAYASAYIEDWKIGPITAMTIDQFKAWLEDGDSARPVAEQVSRYAKNDDQPRVPKGDPDGGQFAPKTGGGVPSGRNRSTHDNIESLVSEAIKTKSGSTMRLDYQLVGKEEAEALRAATGLDLAEYIHTIDDSAIRHTLRKHGAGQHNAGELPITEEDLHKIPEIIANYDKVEFQAKNKEGHDLIRWRKRINGHVFVVEEVLTGRKRLRLKTAYKYPSGSYPPKERAAD